MQLRCSALPGMLVLWAMGVALLSTHSHGLHFLWMLLLRARSAPAPSAEREQSCTAAANHAGHSGGVCGFRNTALGSSGGTLKVAMCRTLWLWKTPASLPAHKGAVLGQNEEENESKLVFCLEWVSKASRTSAEMDSSSEADSQHSQHNPRGSLGLCPWAPRAWLELLPTLLTHLHIATAQAPDGGRELCASQHHGWPKQADA